MDAEKRAAAERAEQMLDVDPVQTVPGGSGTTGTPMPRPECA